MGSVVQEHQAVLRLQGVVIRVWHRHGGVYQQDIRALLALVDEGQLTIRDAHERLVELDHSTAGRRMHVTT